MSEADSTSTPLNQVDDECNRTFNSEIAQKLGEAMEETATTETQASDIGRERNVGNTANPPNVARETQASDLGRERNVGNTADPPIATCVGDDRDVLRGNTLKDTLGGRVLISGGTL